ncbi:MAG TPA: ABC transporter permease subunit, partial [Ktedonobacterales bacterium]|nr:ABC transporter permease subunit [Ktedonobacterales bacterium]
LIILLVAFYAITIGFLCFVTAQVMNQPLEVGRCPPNAIGCQEPSQQELQRERAAEIAPLTDQFTFPTSLGFAASFTRVVGLILICIMAGTLVGSEYGFSTQRLALSRGTSRLQILLAQTLALAVFSMIVAAGMLVLGTLVGAVVGPAFGIAVSAPSFGGWMEILKFFLAFAFSLFAYTIVALGAATLGKSTAAGIGLALGYIVLEFIMSSVLTAIGTVLVATHNDIGKMLQHIPDWFLGNNVGAIMGHAGQYPIALAAAPSADLTLARTLIVSLIYCAIFFGGSFLLLSRRDVTD